jgi:cell division protein ZipA
MGTRELVILLLGLAIIAVILRGLYIAIQARRGQIRLAIDKNIPQNVDLEAMELAELPGGGARVVDRSFAEAKEHNSALQTANARARQLDLGDTEDNSEPVPVLMDTVELAELVPRAQADHTSQGKLAADEDPDAVLFDYREETEDSTDEFDHEPGDTDSWEEEIDSEESATASLDGMSAVMPDYPDEQMEQDEDDSESDWAAESAVEETDTHAKQWKPAEEESDFTESMSEDLAEGETDAEELYQSSSNQETEFEDELDEFSMTAGDRIGYNGPQAVETQQTALFDDQVDEDKSAAVEKPKRRSLFAVFSRHKESENEDLDPVAEEESFAVENLQSSEAASHAQPVATEITAPAIQPAEVIVINVMSREERAFAGEDLLQVLITAGLKFGDMNIFHQRLGSDSKGAVVFSVANILNPGTFDLNNMDEFTTLGISLFLALPSSINNLEAFEQMLAVAQQIRGALDGELKDDNRNVMTTQTIEHYRQRIQDFELRQLKAVGGRG